MTLHFCRRRDHGGGRLNQSRCKMSCWTADGGWQKKKKKEELLNWCEPGSCFSISLFKPRFHHKEWTFLEDWRPGNRRHGASRWYWVKTKRKFDIIMMFTRRLQELLSFTQCPPPPPPSSKTRTFWHISTTWIVLFMSWQVIETCWL